MQWFNLPIVVGLVLLVIVIVLVRRRKSDPDAENMSYELKERLLNDAQCSFLSVLEQAVGEDHRVMVRVRVADVISVGNELEGKDLEQAAGRLQSRQFTFMVYTRDSLEPVCAVELDEPSVRRSKANRDLQLDEICELAGFPLLRIPAQQKYLVADIGLQFDALFAAGHDAFFDEDSDDRTDDRAGEWFDVRSDTLFASQDARLSAGDSVPVMPAGLSLSARQDSPAAQSFGAASGLGSSAAPSMQCPECGAPMVVRQAPKGASSDKAFWICSLAPACRQRMPLVRREDVLSHQLEGLVP